ncbi:MAG: MATE family efflux transporter [Vallitaleaceae bacterium]|jgi:putative MATE family efflux protein|nr:MATE family efflux transporter [Vallitaleaceae bacterium]
MDKNKMGIMPIPKLITTMALPVIFSMLIQALYNVVDSIYVSRVSDNALEALSLAFPMQLIVIAAFVGLGTGLSSAISRRLGAKESEGAGLVAEHGILIAGILYALVALLGAFVMKNLFVQFTSDQVVIDLGSTYIQIVMIFSLGSIFNQAAMSIFRGTGDMIKPMVAQMLGAGLNIFLDWVLIFGKFGLPAMGVKGAAIATVTAQIIAMIYIWSQLLSGKSIIKMKIKAFKVKVEIIKEILVVGVPSAIMQGLGSVMLFTMNLILSRFGGSAVTVMGVYFKVQSMVFMPIFGLAIGTMPVVGFNYGSKNKKRIKDAVLFSIKVAIAFMSICLVVFQVFPTQLLGLFNASNQMLEIGVPAFRTISLIFPLFAVNVILSTTFQGLGKAYFSLIISTIRQIVVLLPIAFLLASFGNVDNVWFAFVIAEIVGIIITVSLFLRTYKRTISIWQD